MFEGFGMMGFVLVMKIIIILLFSLFLFFFWAGVGGGGLGFWWCRLRGLGFGGLGAQGGFWGLSFVVQGLGVLGRVTVRRSSAGRPHHLLQVSE